MTTVVALLVGAIITRVVPKADASARIARVSINVYIHK